ncbi:hypothetical protein ACQP1O_28635 [Nocardia sp. CA-151230]
MGRRLFDSNPLISVHYKGMNAIFTNDWRDQLTLDLTSPALQ